MVVITSVFLLEAPSCEISLRHDNGLMLGKKSGAKNYKSAVRISIDDAIHP